MHVFFYIIRFQNECLDMPKSLRIENQWYAWPVVFGSWNSYLWRNQSQRELILRVAEDQLKDS